MGLPGIKKRDKEDWEQETGAELGRLALMLGDGTQHKDERYPRLTQFPPRMRVAGFVESALEFGVHPDNIFIEAWRVVQDDPGEDEAALAILTEYRDAIAGPDKWGGTDEEIANAVFLLASFDAGSLWTRAVQAAYPDHPQTPGSAGWIEAEAKGNPHESVACPWTRKP